jgi:ATP-dependent Clp protease adaptor protein ClpS
MPPSLFPSEYGETELYETTELGLASRVVLYNDEIHTYDEVITQIRKATRCSLQKAEILTIEVDTQGKAIVYDGEITDCIRVSAILEEIELHTQIVC